MMSSLQSVSNIEILQMLIRLGWIMEKKPEDQNIQLRKDDFVWSIHVELPIWSLIEMLESRGNRK